MSNYKERLELFENILNHKVDYSIKDFRKLCFKGIPENAHVKATSWKILLNYISLDEYDEWETKKNEKRKSYYEFVKELIIEPSWEEIINAKKEIVAVEDHPLNEAPTSKWTTYFSELTVLEQIDKDSRRTLPDLGFFQNPIVYNSEIIEENKKLGNVEPFLGIPISKRRSLFSRLEHKIKDDDFGARSHKMSLNTSNSQTNVIENNVEYDLHWEALERILFIYAKLNPGIGYIQGMNEILGPIYYVLANDIGIDQLHAEADSFYLFTSLMSIFRDHFIRNLDSVGVKSRVVKNEMTMENLVKLKPQDKPQSQKSVGKRIIGNENGIGQSMLRLYKRIELRDREVYIHLRSKKILPAYFAFRWLSVLLTQEFNLPEIIRIWDSLLSDINMDIFNEDQMEKRKRDGRFDFLIELCCAMIMCVRKKIITEDTADIIKLLQNYPIQDVNIVLQLAYKNFERPLRPRITSEQIQQRQEYLKRKHQQQLQQTRSSEVTNQIKNSINSLENKLQSLDFSKMFNQVSEKLTSITSPITDKSFSYFDNDDEIETTSSHPRNDSSDVTTATTTTTTTTKKDANSLVHGSSKNTTSMNSSNPPPPPRRSFSTNNTNSPIRNNQGNKVLQKKTSLTTLASSGIENASIKLSGWFKTGSSVLSNAFSNINNIINDTPSNDTSSSSTTSIANKRASAPPRINRTTSNSIQHKLSDPNENVPILKSSSDKVKPIRTVSSQPKLRNRVPMASTSSNTLSGVASNVQKSTKPLNPSTTTPIETKIESESVVEATSTTSHPTSSENTTSNTN
ncbi:RabGAP/TBC [Piromyces finnis]|uniref:RabGAP/TBC n=1 Tax=Piromyces finnis TaxID=1754191 RepID=A0A1Y1V2G3_9FUNG|nr:RabGAP/TBC [Piromyces finnis]|eukprot:ORX45764.1 RabGAP/TBC [Piromyces finnis]